MGKKKCVFVILLLIIISVAYIFQFQSVNNRFPQETVEVIEAGQGIIYEDIEYKVISGEIITGEEYIKRYTDDKNFEKDNELFFVWLELENQTDSEKHMKVSDMVANCGVWANGVDYFSLWTINGEDFDGMLKPHEKKRIGIISPLTTNSEVIRKSSAQWRVRLSGWPNRIEMIVPVEQERK